ncbi:hypothetical protein [Sphingomonas cavernae]|uniref:Uncharacterized protein n=1 Tax=Sphingomonas cavernae TaxID=2320861 RepID=A0A418WLW3_9SPHN|nr:hypothetical protein [Sphingomonas cavernae]RJF90995.1 hypothetical protein D3876_12640 [Sphingomonas cavernae]
MAYLDLANSITVPTIPATRMRAVTAATATFSACEWTIVELARHDSPASLYEPGRGRRLVETIFGIRRANPLADPRLEALRRMAVLLRRGLARLSPDEIARFLGFGFSQGHLAVLEQHVAKAAR